MTTRKKSNTGKPKTQVASYLGSQPECSTKTAAPQYAGTACVITCHNYGKYLVPCLESCLSQSRPFESIIVVDDASTDHTAEVTRRYASRGVRYLRGEWKNYSAARMAGVAALPRTPFLLFVDADNSLSRTYHERLHAAMTESNLGATYGHLLQFDETGTLGLNESVRPFDHHDLRRQNLADACSLVRREAFDQIGGWKTDSFLTDWMMWMDMTRHGWKMRHVPEAVLNYRVHKEQMSSVRFGNWDIHVAPMRRSCMIAMVTLFSGRHWALDRHFDWLKRLEWNRENIHVVALDNSNDPKFSRNLKNHLMKSDLAFSYVADRGQALKETGAAEFAGSRLHRSRNAYTLATHLARLYAVARQHIPAGADFIWSVEDDIEPPADALHHLCKGIFRYPGTGAVTGCARSRFEDQWILWKKGAALHELPGAGFYTSVEAAGFYCMLLRRPVFDAIAFRPTRDWSLQNCAYDWAATHDIVQGGWNVLASGSVRCKHWQEDGSYL